MRAGVGTTGRRARTGGLVDGAAGDMPGIGRMEGVTRSTGAVGVAGTGDDEGCTCDFMPGAARSPDGTSGLSGISDGVLSASASVGIVASALLVLRSCAPTTRSSSIRAVQ